MMTALQNANPPAKTSMEMPSDQVIRDIFDGDDTILILTTASSDTEAVPFAVYKYDVLQKTVQVDVHDKHLPYPTTFGELERNFSYPLQYSVDSDKKKEPIVHLQNGVCGSQGAGDISTDDCQNVENIFSYNPNTHQIAVSKKIQYINPSDFKQMIR